MRQAFPGHYGYGPYTSHAGAPTDQTDRLANIKRAIDSIEQRLGAPSTFGADTPAFGAPAADTAAQLGQLQQQLAKLSGNIPSSSGASDVARRQAELNAQSAEQARAEANEKAARDAAAAAAEAQKRATELQSRMEKTQTDGNAALTAIARQLQELRKDLGTVKQEIAKPTPAPANPVAKVDQSDIDRIAAALSELQSDQDQAPDETGPRLDTLTAELNALRQTLLDDLKNARGEDATTLLQREAHAQQRAEERDQDIQQRLDALSRGLDTLADHAAATVSPKVESLGHRMEELRTSVEDMPQTLAISRLEDRMADLAMKLEDMADRPAVAAAPATDISGLENRLDEIARALVAVSNMSRKSPKLDMTAIDRLEARMSDLGRAVDAMATASVKAMDEANANAHAFVEASAKPNPEIEALSVRIEGLVERLGSFEKYAQDGDLGAASQMFAGPEVGQIEDQLRQITQRLDAHHAPDLSALEQQVHALSQHMQEAATVHSTAAQMSNLEAQIGQILRQLNKQEPHAPIDFAPVESRLGAIETQLGQIPGQLSQMPVELAQQAAEHAAQQAAQQAVSLMGTAPEQGEILAALSEDLKALQHTASKAQSAAAPSTEVTSTLHAVLDRLTALEGAVESTPTLASEAVEARVSSLLDSRPLAGPVAAAPIMPHGAPNLANTAAAPMAPFPKQQPMQEPMQPPAVDEAMFAADGLNDAAGSNEQFGVIHQAALASGFVAPPTAPVDPIQMQNAMQAGHTAPHVMVPEGIPENNAPLEPGSPAPQIDDYLKQAAQTLNQAPNSPSVAQPVASPEAPVRVPGGDGVETDFTAAARKAAAYARDEGAGDAKDKKAKKSDARGGSDLKSRIEGLLAKAKSGESRRPLIMAAAAVLLTALVWNGWSMLTAPDAPADRVVEQSAPATNSTGSETAANTAADGSEPLDGARAVRTVDGDDRVMEGAPKADQASAVVDQNAPTPAPAPAPSEPNSAATNTQTASDEKPANTAPSAGSSNDVAYQSPATTNAPDDAAAAPTDTQSATRSVQTTAVYDVPATAGPAALVAAAGAGDQKALFQLGMRYSEGSGVTRNMKQAAVWFERAAKTGFAPAQYSLGSLYEKGIGVERDVAKAAQWYDQAAAQGNARAMHNLAVIRAMGNPPSIQPDINTAVDWFQKAAGLGIKDSQFNLGILYGRGMGVPQDLAQSYKWFALAAKTGDTDAGKKRDEVANAMDPKDLEAARKIVQNWRPEKLNEATNRVAVPKEWRSNSASTGAAASGKALVKQAQALLNRRGFNVGTPDGLIGPKTTRAIMEFQRSAGLAITGKVDRTLMQALGTT